MVILQIRNLSAIALLLLHCSVYAQADSSKTHRPFLEIGAGYLLNGGGTLAYLPENILVGYTNFNHGARANIHFGLPVFKNAPLPIGVAAKYGVHVGFPFQNKIRTRYEKEFPGLNFTFRTPPWYFNSLQIGPYISTRQHGKWGADLELLFGFGKVRVPELTIFGVESSKYYVYIAQLPTVSYMRTISPALSVRRYYSANKYVFARAEAIFGIGNLAFEYYDYYPEGNNNTSFRLSPGAPLRYVYEDNSYYLLNLVIGTNINIGR